MVNPYWKRAVFHRLHARCWGRSGRIRRATRRGRNLEVVSGGRGGAWVGCLLGRLERRDGFRRGGQGWAASGRGAANALGAVKFLFPNEVGRLPGRHAPRSAPLPPRPARLQPRLRARREPVRLPPRRCLAHDGRISGRGARRMGGRRREVDEHEAQTFRSISPTSRGRWTPRGRLVRLEDIYGFDRGTRRALGLSAEVLRGVSFRSSGLARQCDGVPRPLPIG